MYGKMGGWEESVFFNCGLAYVCVCVWVWLEGSASRRTLVCVWIWWVCVVFLGWVGVGERGSDRRCVCTYPQKKTAEAGLAGYYLVEDELRDDRLVALGVDELDAQPPVVLPGVVPALDGFAGGF